MTERSSRRRTRVRRGERGQMLIIFVVMLSLIFLAAAAAIDYGLWLSEKRGIARASDLAALASVYDLPADPDDDTYLTNTGACSAVPACDAVHVWAERNGYGEADGATVEVYFFCSNDIENPPQGICENGLKDFPDFPISACPDQSGETGCDTVRVIVKKGAVSLFSGMFGGVNFDIGSSSFARVEFVVSPVDIAMSIDASGSMQGNKLTQAKIAATDFAEAILGMDPDSSPSQVGYTPYRACYEPDDDDGCVPSIDLPPSSSDCNDPDDSWVLCLGRDLELIEEKIQDTQANNATNVCLGLFSAREVVTGPGSRNNVDRFVVILTDGDNVFQPHPTVVEECWPHSNNEPGAPQPPDRCGQGPGGDDRDLDRCTFDLAEGMKTNNCDDDPDTNTPYCIEIYVVGLEVEGDDNGDVPGDPGLDCDDIGNDDPDDEADRRLLKCIASSSPGTNDHYFETDDAGNLPSIFQGIAFEIAARGLSGGPGE